MTCRPPGPVWSSWPTRCRSRSWVRSPGGSCALGGSRLPMAVGMALVALSFVVLTTLGATSAIWVVLVVHGAVGGRAGTGLQRVDHRGDGRGARRGRRRRVGAADRAAQRRRRGGRRGRHPRHRLAPAGTSSDAATPTSPPASRVRPGRSSLCRCSAPRSRCGRRRRVRDAAGGHHALSTGAPR